MDRLRVLQVHPDPEKGKAKAKAKDRGKEKDPDRQVAPDHRPPRSLPQILFAYVAARQDILPETVQSKAESE